MAMTELERRLYESALAYFAARRRDSGFVELHAVGDGPEYEPRLVRKDAVQAVRPAPASAGTRPYRSVVSTAKGPLYVAEPYEKIREMLL